MSARFATMQSRLAMRASVGAEAPITMSAPDTALEKASSTRNTIVFVVVAGVILLLIASPFILGYYVLTRG